MNLVNNDRMTKVISVVLAVMFGVLFVTLVANAVTTISTAVTTAGDITTSAGNIEATAGTLTVGGVSTLSGNTILSTASSTGLVKVKSLKVEGTNGSTVSSIIFGYCTLAAIDVSAATTTYALCTGAGDVANVTSSDKVFVQATSSLPVATVVTAASSTATTGTINVRFHATAGATAISAATVSLQVWAVR